MKDTAPRIFLLPWDCVRSCTLLQVGVDQRSITVDAAGQVLTFEGVSLLLGPGVEAPCRVSILTLADGTISVRVHGEASE